MYFATLKVVDTQFQGARFQFPQNKSDYLVIINKMLRKLLLAKLYESNNINVRIITHHIFRSWQEDFLIDIDAFFKYEFFSISI